MLIKLKLKAVEGDTFNPLWNLLTQNNISFKILGYKFGSIAEIEIPEEEIQETIQAISTATKYTVLKQTFA